MDGDLSMTRQRGIPVAMHEHDGTPSSKLPPSSPTKRRDVDVSNIYDICLRALAADREPWDRFSRAFATIFVTHIRVAVPHVRARAHGSRA